MKIAVTGCNGRVGSRVVACALRRGHQVVGIDHTDPPTSEDSKNPNFVYIKADIRDYETTLKSLQGCEGVAHLAAVPNPADYVAVTHNSNVAMSWNVLRAAVELGITRIAQASSVNIMRLVYSKTPTVEYFPVDEDHPCQPDEPYGLSKQIAELQADTIVRRYPATRIASLRLHWSIPNRAYGSRDNPAGAAKDLWGYVQEDCAADAFLLAITNEDGKWSGHERFFISAPDTRWKGETMPLYEEFWSHVPIREGKDLSGRKAFYDASKAERLLGWKHAEPEEL